MAIPAAAAAAYRAAAQIGSTPRRQRRARPTCRARISATSCRARSRIPSTPSARANRPPPPRSPGKANLVDVVQQVNQAELTLDTVVAVRDKVVAPTSPS